MAFTERDPSVSTSTEGVSQTNPEESSPVSPQDEDAATISGGNVATDAGTSDGVNYSDPSVPSPTENPD